MPEANRSCIVLVGVLKTAVARRHHPPINHPKIALIFLLCTFLLFGAKAQVLSALPFSDSTTIDSLKRLLPTTQDDSTKIRLLERIGITYDFSNVDSAFHYYYAALALANRTNLLWAQARTRASLSSAFINTGRFAEALDVLFQSLTIAEKDKNPLNIARAYRRLGGVYFNIGNYTKAAAYHRAALTIDEKTQTTINTISIDYFGLGDDYEKIGKLDSAHLYLDKALKNKEKILDYVPRILLTKGDIALKQRDIKQAMRYYKQALVACLPNSNKGIASEINSAVARLFLENKQRDSSLQYAMVALKLAHESSYKNNLITATYLLGELYSSTDPARAIDYYKLSYTTKDSLFGVRNLESIQTIFDQNEAKKRQEQEAVITYRNNVKLYAVVVGILVLSIIVFILFKNNRQQQQANKQLRLQKEEINTQRTKAENALTELRATQTQLVQKEKMASLGELTAGIAHEIQNPLNFVNNFSEVSTELVDELKEGPFQKLPASEKDYAGEILGDLTQNLQKITHHGGRASSIVKGMLEHSRTSNGERQSTDLNALTDEYLRLAYQGLRAKDKTASADRFNCELITDFDPALGLVNVVPQEIGRVLLNLFNNAFYAVQQKLKTAPSDYQPTVTVSTALFDDKAQIRVKDNGMGIPEAVKAKIFQPFFTTKPTGEGTGLGLSLSYDIVIKGHGGELYVEDQEGESTTFIIKLPI